MLTLNLTSKIEPQLLWRDYFRLVALKSGSKLYHPYSLRGNPPPNLNREWSTDKSSVSVKRFLNGKTGVPFVDASIRELLATGYVRSGMQTFTNL